MCILVFASLLCSWWRFKFQWTPIVYNYFSCALSIFCRPSSFASIEKTSQVTWMKTPSQSWQNINVITESTSQEIIGRASLLKPTDAVRGLIWTDSTGTATTKGSRSMSTARQSQIIASARWTSIKPSLSALQRRSARAGIEAQEDVLVRTIGTMYGGHASSNWEIVSSCPCGIWKLARWCPMLWPRPSGPNLGVFHTGATRTTSWGKKPLWRHSITSWAN